MISRFKAAVISLSALLLLSCNGGGNNTQPETLNVDFVLPSRIEVPDDTKEYTFDTKDGKSPLTTDLFMLSSSGGVSSACPITAVSPSSFTVRLGVPEGDYDVVLRRGDLRKSFGRTSVKYVDNIEFTPDEGTSVWGVVKCGDKGLPGVVVSDGAETVQTDERGIYQIKSDKKWGYVFISIPSGYEVPSDGVLPRFHSYLVKGAKEVERADFRLTEASQDKYKVFMLGDMHLANRTGDLYQFRSFAADLNSYIASHKGEKMYAFTLGDMTWDLYWYSNKYDFEGYLKTMNSSFSGLQFFHTMGNHDNDFKAMSDMGASEYYVSEIAPTYYSLNIGGIHYVVLDDIDCSEYDGSEDRNYSKSISAEQLDWLRKDLSYIDKTIPVVVLMHAQVFYPSGSGFKIDHDRDNTNELFSILDGREVRFVTGHTHRAFNVTPEDGITSGRNFREHNSGSICASWWWSGHLTPGVHISQDGTPGGYGIWDVSGSEVENIVYKATGYDESYQLRSYDLNNVSFTWDDVPNLEASDYTLPKVNYQKYMNAYPENRDNKVLLNIWNWGSDWSLSIKDERGNPLTYTSKWAYDPLHIAALSVKRLDGVTKNSIPSFLTETFHHFFEVRLNDPDTDIVITVTDGYGNTWTETMQRPKEFSIDAYKLQ